MERKTFNDLGLIDPILKALHEEGYTHPTPIQEQAIPHLIQGRDLLGCAQTGTGKTAAFAIPILQELHANEVSGNKKYIRNLILTPTRELAIQIGESFAAYGRHLNLKHTVIFGGVGQKPQTDALHRGVDIVVATPGRLLDLMQQGFIKLDQLEIFVLDEADRMLDMGFIHDVKKVIAKLPKKRQTLFFSATMPTEIAKLANSILTDPMKVEVAPVSSTADTIDQTLFYVDRTDKNKLLVHLLEGSAISEALIFTRTKHGANKVAKILVQAGHGAEAIHGNKSQTARQNALKNFKDGKIRALVATDIASRGIDIDGLSHVINFDIPNIPETYVHRIGRTGRAGSSGKALSFVDHEEKTYLRDILRLIKRDIPEAKEHPFPMIGGPKKPEKEEPRERQQRSGIQRNPRGSRPQGERGPRPERNGQKPVSAEGRLQRNDQRNRPPREKGADGNDEQRVNKPRHTNDRGARADRGPRPEGGPREDRGPRPERKTRSAQGGSEQNGERQPRQNTQRRNDRGPRQDRGPRPDRGRNARSERVERKPEQRPTDAKPVEGAAAISPILTKPDYGQLSKELFGEDITKPKKEKEGKKGGLLGWFGKKK